MIRRKRRPTTGAATVRGTLFAALLLLLPLAGCGRSGDSGAAHPDGLERVEAPPDLPQLDGAVREQFESLYAAVRDEGSGTAWGTLGRWFQVYGYEESARHSYRNASRLDPEEPRWPYHLGTLAQDVGELEQAESLYRRAAELAPAVASPKVRLGDLALQRQQLDRSERLYREVLAVDPDDPGALFGSARVALARDEPEAAIEPLERLAREQPEAVQVHYTLGLAWRRLGDDRRADEALGRVPADNLDQVALDLGSAWERELSGLDVGARTLTRRGVRAFRRGEPEKAAALLGRAVRADPEGPEKRINYALALHGLGQWRAALEQLREAIALADEGSELAAKAHLETGRLLADLGRPRAAVQHLEAALAIDPASPPAHVALGRLRHRQGDLEAALAHYAVVRGSGSGGDDARFWHAALLLALGRTADAREALAMDLETATEPRGSSLLLARLFATASDPGLRDVAQARTLLDASGPADVLFAETAAMVAAAGDRFDEAAAWQRAAIDRLADLPPRTTAHTARRRLVLYERQEPCRTPWETGELLVRALVEVPTGVTSDAGPATDEATSADGLASPRPVTPSPGRPAPAESAGAAASAAGAPPGGALFVDVAAASGLRFEHDNGGTGELYFVEPVGAGGALADLDGDGDLDVILVQSGPLGASGSDSGSGSNPGSRVFRNDLSIAPDGTRTLRFTDVTEQSGFTAIGYGMGVATGDYDDDGRVDVYLTAFGPNQLWRNVSRDGRLRFEDVTARAGVDDPRWSTSASFSDLDGDGRLDLFVTNYVDFRLATHRPCRSPGGRPDYCGPQAYRGETDRLFLNRGDGTFRDASAEAGITERGSGLGVVTDDFDRDGRIDVYVANDLERNFLWRNLGSSDGVPRFENVALETGSAVSMLGRAQASMGVVAGDVDNDGDSDLFMTHLSADTNTLYVNDGRGLFTDRSAPSGLGNPSLAGTGFGTVLVDYDNDGWLDVFVANGAVKVIEALARAGDPYPLDQVNQLFANRSGRFVEVSAEAGPELARLEVSRGVAVGDVDDDGRADLLLVNNEGPARLLHNRSRSPHAWLGLRLLTRTGRDALGARVEVVRRGAPTLHRRAATDGSYLSANDPRVLVGLGEAGEGAEVRVHWVDGTTETWTGLAPNRYHTLRAGEGRP